MKKLLCTALCTGFILILGACKAPVPAAQTPTPPPIASPAPGDELRALLAGIKAEDIVYIDYDTIKAADLAPLLNAAMEQVGEHDGLTVNGSPTDIVWGVTFYLKSVGEGVYSGEDAVYLYASLEEDLVEISSGFLPDRLHCRGSGLYQLVRSVYDHPWSGVDQVAYEGLRDVVDGRMASTLARFQAYSEEAGYSGTELLSFRPVETYDDLTAVGTVTVYNIGYALLMDHPEYAFQVGGTALDSQCREIGCDEYPYLAVLREKGEVTYTSFLFYDSLPSVDKVQYGF